MLRLVTYGFIGILLGFIVAGAVDIFIFNGDDYYGAFYIPVATFPILGIGMGHWLNMRADTTSNIGGFFLTLLILVVVIVIFVVALLSTAFGVH